MKNILFIFSIIICLNYLNAPLLNAEENSMRTEKAFDQKQVKAYIIQPFTSFEGSAQSFIQLRIDEKPLLDVQLRALKEGERFSAKYKGDGSLEISYRPSPEVGEIIIARQKLSDGWYPSAEICSSASLSVKCQYFILRDEANKTLSLKIFKKN